MNVATPPDMLGNGGSQNWKYCLMSANRTGRRLFAYSSLDAILILITAIQFGIILWAANSFRGLAIFDRAVLGIGLCFLTLTQYHVVMHNFIHTRFFCSKTL